MRNKWLPGWLPAALTRANVCVEYFGRHAEALPGMEDRYRLWAGWYWHVERRRGPHRYVEGDIFGPYRSRSAAMDAARIRLGLSQRDGIRRVA